MSGRSLALCIGAALMVALCGCGPNPAARVERSAPASSLESSAGVWAKMRDIDDNYHLAENRARALQELVMDLTPSEPPEPKGDVTHGVHLGHITSISGTDTAVVMTVDFVTPDMQPGLTKQQRTSSGWPDFFGWNRYVHPQRFKADDSGHYFDGGLEFRGGLLGDFVSDWRANSGRSDLLYYIQVSDGEISDIWPWVY